ncbi:MAG: hypothetical protein FWG21_04950 [Oscillospiraceae bacterium]|nr:hypothetical protein [Oscillospiraceae bacterium]
MDFNSRVAEANRAYIIALAESEEQLAEKEEQLAETKDLMVELKEQLAEKDKMIKSLLEHTVESE